MKGVSFGLVIVAFLGLILIIVSNSSMSYNGFDVDVVLSMVGSVLFVGTITGYIFENRTKEKLFGEIFERINKDLSIRNAGIESCFEASTDISYRDEIKHAREITTLFTYADGFLKRHMEELLDAATRGAILKFIFVRQDSQIISAMEGLGWAKTSISANYESLKVFEKRFEGKNVSFHYVDAIPRLQTH
ncbi:hypothetical protein [Tabrizicola soli]|uniref:Uncharacterized protein n=1 Tax=Tabrizicola soli TaxID=2185115 RepID=A0ABV7DQS6_9RHOB|nr:hypothetical protein [Tabrizicola soli]